MGKNPDSNDRPAESHPDLVAQFGSDDLYQAHASADLCITLIHAFLWERPGPPDPDRSVREMGSNLASVLDGYIAATRYDFAFSQEEFIVASNGTATMCGIEEPSAHNLAFRLTERVVGELRRSSGDVPPDGLILALSREGLEALKTMLLREYVIAKHKREERLKKSWEPGVPPDLYRKDGAPPPTTPESDATKEKVNKGGRNPKRDKLWTLMQEMKAKDPKVTDARIAAVFNQRFARSISNRTRKPATRRTVRDVRYYYTRRQRDQDHG
jgi:hypothetical protein